MKFAVGCSLLALKSNRPKSHNCANAGDLLDKADVLLSSFYWLEVLSMLFLLRDLMILSLFLDNCGRSISIV